MRPRIDPHARYRELIAARLDKPLTRVQLRTLNGHLKKCAACQSIEAEYRSQRDLLRGLAVPIAPRDLWARTSAGLDREVARSYRADKWRRRVTRGSRAAQPSTALLTAIAAVGVSAALVVLQFAPTAVPLDGVPARPTPLSISPLQLLLIGQGRSDVAVYQTDVSQVCPVSGPLDCIQAQKFVRTPISLPADVRAGNIALSPGGKQLAVVGHKVGEDVIAVVTMPQDSAGKGGGKGNGDSGGSGQGGNGPAKTNDGNGLSGPQAVPTSVPASPGSAADQPSGPPASAVAGLAVLSILDNVQSAGAPPDWSANGEMLAFSAMPDDGSTGPDVYVWSPGDAKATAITTDHSSFFASWSGNRIVVSRITPDSAKPSDFVIDPGTLEQRAVGGPQLWLPTVNTERTQAIGWFGQLDTSATLPAARSGALYLMDWASVDPFGSAAPPANTDGASSDDVTASPGTDQPGDPGNSDQQTPAPNGGSKPGATGSTPAPRATASSARQATPNPTPTDGNGISGPQTAPAVVPSSLTPLEPDRDPRAAPVVDWQARWSSDGKVLGVWIADSEGSSWGRLAVLAVDPGTQLVTSDDPLLPMTMARRGFSLGEDQVAWVGPTDDSVDGELRIRTWGSDGIGGLRLKAPAQEEVTPAS